MALMTSNNTSSIAPPDSMLPAPMNRRQYMDFALLCWCCGLAVSCFGVVSNIINIRTFVAMGVKSGVDVLFLALSLSDLGYVLFTCVRNSMFIAYWLEDKLGVWLLLVDPFAVGIFGDNSAITTYTVSALTSTFLAVARCMCVVRPLQFKHIFTRNRCLVAVLIMACFPYACWAPVFAEMGVVRKFDEVKNASRLAMWMSPDRERVKDLASFILRFAIPIVNQTLLVLCVPAMVHTLRESTRFRSGNTVENTGKDASSSKLSARDRQVVEQVVLISAIYIVVNIPIILVSFLGSIDSRFYYGKRFEFLYRLIHNVRAVLEAINASVNIFVYYFYNSKFRSLCFSSKRKKPFKA